MSGCWKQAAVAGDVVIAVTVAGVQCSTGRVRVELKAPVRRGRVL